MIKKTVNVLLASTLSMAVFSSTAQAFSEDEIVIWVGADKAFKGVEQVGKLFEEEMGIRVKVETPENLPDRFPQAASTGQGPDIVMWAHDRYGEWVASGLLAEVKPSKSFHEGVEELGWQATQVNGKNYGYPVAMEAISLIYNKDIIKEPPASFEAMFEMDKDLSKKGLTTILWDQGNPYFSTPMLLSNNGYVFKETSTGYDTANVGINSDNARKAADVFSKLIEKDVMPRGADYGVMDSTFNKGKAAMMITGPWAWSNLDKSGINYGVAPLPSVNGSPARAIVGVWGAAINNATPNKALAKEFLENYLLTDAGLKTMNKDVSLGAVADKSFMAELKSDPRIATTYENARNGLLMPNVPEMLKFWTAMDIAFRNISSGRESVDVALSNAEKSILN
ncbi:maltose/maltodextrin ABC transporter substrate-binding protein MalE [Endozoicomonas arenosclerae]|uniref:maltose/maltodextrin ABC transporter substrate-binding protein MalE n=1 Tax=Endozoicomonas arenosclerae TaxID=1633495 RepID=UPI0007814D22|nr:maltose/maltodextrin ABC transporter substrate-binding protein MalE [Endozoicomonas arenosclerae]